MAGLVLHFILLSCRYEVGGVWGGGQGVWSGVNSFHICCESVLYGDHVMSTSLSISKRSEEGRWTERKRPLFFICSGKMNEKCDIAPFLPFLCLLFDWTDF
jgi:hypothetical protein